MKLVKEVRKFELNGDIKVNEYYELENVLSCDKFVIKIIEVDHDGIKAIKLSTGKVEEYTYNTLQNYEARKMKLVYEDGSSILQQAASTQNVKEMTKEECERATDEYQKQLGNIVRQVFGDNVRVYTA